MFTNCLLNSPIIYIKPVALKHNCLNRVPLMRKGASVVWHLSFTLMNSFNKNEAAIFLMQAVFPEDYPSSQLHITYYSWCFVACVAALKCRPLLHHCVVIFYCFLGIVFVNISKWAPLMCYWASVVWHFSLPLINSLNKTCYFPHARCASWWLFLFKVAFKIIVHIRCIE